MDETSSIIRPKPSSNSRPKGVAAAAPVAPSYRKLLRPAFNNFCASRFASFIDLTVDSSRSRRGSGGGGCGFLPDFLQSTDSHKITQRRRRLSRFSEQRLRHEHNIKKPPKNDTDSTHSYRRSLIHSSQHFYNHLLSFVNNPSLRQYASNIVVPLSRKVRTLLLYCIRRNVRRGAWNRLITVLVLRESTHFLRRYAQ